MSEKIVADLVAFAAALVLTLILTPLVREMNRRLGMVDKPDPRRINKVPIPRGGGLAVYVSVAVVFLCAAYFFENTAERGISARHLILTPIAGVLTLLGYADDKFSLSPKLKLLGQILVAAATWWFGNLGFHDLWPALPAWVDCALTVFWIVGAINAFNLIDGLDGLASGLALVATIGMAGVAIFAGHAGELIFYFTFAGGLLGFLRYNYNPASVFLGDSGSMMIGYTLSVLPLCSHATDSFLVSVGVPILAMGVPIFDTSLAIFRRTVRRLLVKSDVIKLEAGDSANVMGADHDHLHHRLLRSFGLNQRKAAWSLYLLAAALVAIGLASICLRAHAAGLWLAVFTVGTVVALHDMSRVELFDVGRLLNRLAHAKGTGSRRLMSRLRIPLYMLADVLALAAVFYFCKWTIRQGYDVRTVRIMLLVRVASVFFCLVFMRTYSTIWPRALASNYFRLGLACVFGTVLGSVILFYAPIQLHGFLKVFTILNATLSFLALVSVRLTRPLVRDLFYSIDCSRLVSRKDVSRVLVYGAGLRYRAFRRELVRTTSTNDRIIVGLLDDDLLLRHHYIGGQKVLGTLAEAPEIINAVNADAVVIACDITPDWLKIVQETLAPTGVKITVFTLNEKEV